VGYVKRNAIAGHRFASLEELQAHVARWMREVADVRMHGTDGVDAEAARQPTRRATRNYDPIAALQSCSGASLAQCAFAAGRRAASFDIQRPVLARNSCAGWTLSTGHSATLVSSAHSRRSGTLRRLLDAAQTVANRRTTKRVRVGTECQQIDGPAQVTCCSLAAAAFVLARARSFATIAPTVVPTMHGHRSAVARFVAAPNRGPAHERPFRTPAPTTQ
jgi:hypothetical protein